MKNAFIGFWKFLCYNIDEYPKILKGKNVIIVTFTPHRIFAKGNNVQKSRLSMYRHFLCELTF